MEKYKQKENFFYGLLREFSPKSQAFNTLTDEEL